MGESVGGPAGGAPTRLWVRPHTTGRRPRAGESVAYARRRIRHLHAGVLKILAPGQGGLITTPAVTFPPRRPGRCAVRRQAGGSAEALAGLRAQERKRKVEPSARQVAPDRAWDWGAWRSSVAG